MSYQKSQEELREESRAREYKRNQARMEEQCKLREARLAGSESARRDLCKKTEALTPHCEDEQ